jgi:hypothetical protein
LQPAWHRKVESMIAEAGRSPLASGVSSLLMGGPALGAVVAVSLAATVLFRVRLSPVDAPPANRAAVSGPGLGLRAERPGWQFLSEPEPPRRAGSQCQVGFVDGSRRRSTQNASAQPDHGPRGYRVLCRPRYATPGGPHDFRARSCGQRIDQRHCAGCIQTARLITGR